MSWMSNLDLIVRKKYPVRIMLNWKGYWVIDEDGNRVHALPFNTRGSAEGFCEQFDLNLVN